MAQKKFKKGAKNVAIKNRIPRCKLDGYFIRTCKISAYYL